LRTEHRQRGKLIGLLAGIGALCLSVTGGWAMPGLPEDLLFRWDARIWGADAAFGWKGWDLFRGVDTELWASAGGGYQASHYFAGQDDSGASDPDAARYDNLNFDWRFGVAQGILFNPEQDRNLVELLLLYRGKYHDYFDPNHVLAGLPEENGLLQHSLTLGLLFDNTSVDKPSLNSRGIYAVLSAEFAPEWLGNEALGSSDYWRLSLGLTGYQPVLDSPMVSIYLADRVMVDRLFGDQVPLSALGSIGVLKKVPIGANPRRALGGTLRGIWSNRYDGLAKLTNNFDVRVHFPALTLFQLVTPVLVAYFDAGVYDQMTGVLQFDPVYCTTGLGLGLYALGFDFILYGTYFLNEGRWGGELGLGAHF
jgi:hypothetical protein